jgi:hypothetical protein
MPLRLLRDFDGTRALLVVLDAQGNAIPMPAGTYTLTATYRLDMGTRAPLLSLRGSSAAEIATLRWTV